MSSLHHGHSGSSPCTTRYPLGHPRPPPSAERARSSSRMFRSSSHRPVLTLSLDMQEPLRGHTSPHSLGPPLPPPRPRATNPLQRYPPRRPLCRRARITHPPRPHPPSKLDLTRARPTQTTHVQHAHRTERAHHFPPVFTRPIQPMVDLRSDDGPTENVRLTVLGRDE